MPKRPQLPPLTMRDEQILVLLHRYRFLTVDLLFPLIHAESGDLGPTRGLAVDGSAHPRGYGFGRQALYKRLRRLHENGLVDRQYLYPQAGVTLRGSPRAVFSLVPRSAQVLARVLKVPSSEIRAGIKSSAVENPFLLHTLGVSRFRVVLELASNQNQERFSQVEWRQGLELRDRVFVQDGDGTKKWYSVYPDAAFIVQTRSKRLKLYFLEYDRGTEPLVTNTTRSNLRDKFIGYYHYRKSGLFLKRYGKKVAGFNVLFVMPDSHSASSRIDNSIDLLRSMGTGFRSSTLFWFTSESAFRIERPHPIGSVIWRTVADQALKSIVN